MGKRTIESELLELRQRIRDLEQVLRGLPSRTAKATPSERFLNVELNSGLTAGGSVTCNVMDWDGADEVDSGADITVYDRGYQMTGVAGNKALARFDFIKQRWEFVQIECDPAGDGSDTASAVIEGEDESEFEPVGP